MRGRHATHRKETNVIGERIGEASGKINSTRVIRCESSGQTKVECSVQESGKLLGVDVTEIATYWSTPRPNGTFYGEGNGIITTRDGEYITWRGTGIGRPSGRGNAMSWRATCYYETTSSKLSRINNTVGLIQFDTDENNNTKSHTWEWKDNH
jgi:hypothetical protein